MDDLPACYKNIGEQYVSKGMIMIPMQEYGTELIYKKVNAPAGYVCDDEEFKIAVLGEYDVKKIEHKRINKAEFVPATGIVMK